MVFNNFLIFKFVLNKNIDTKSIYITSLMNYHSMNMPV